MYAVVRDYSGKGAGALFDILEQRKAEVESILREVQGFVSYTCARNDAGGFSVTVCQDKTGTDESLRVAKEWIVKNAANTGVGAQKSLRVQSLSRQTSLRMGTKSCPPANAKL